MAWIITISAVVFLLLILPGIRRNGTVLTVDSVPPDSAVYVDGIRLGPTGEEVFAPKGGGLLTIRRDGYQDYEEERYIKGRVFASRIFPRRLNLTVSLEALEGFDALAAGLADYRSWAATGPEDGRYAIPSSLTSAARAAVSEDSSPDDAARLAEASLPHARDERQIADTLRAMAILIGAGSPPDIGDLAVLARQAAGYLDEYPRAKEGLAVLSDAERVETLGFASFLSAYVEGNADMMAAYPGYYGDSIAETLYRRPVYGGLEFIEIPARSAPVGDLEVVSAGYIPRSGAHPRVAEAKKYAISLREITNDQFQAFVSANPRWSVENIDELIESGSVDGAYLSDWSESGPAPGTGGMPVTGVSWYAAAAYASWFSDSYVRVPDLEARLPGEVEWEIAARLDTAPDSTENLPPELAEPGRIPAGRIGLRGMAGNVREWCSDSFSYSSSFFGRSEADGTEKVIRGGSFIDESLPYPASIRGGLEADRCSPVTGFRLVVAGR